MSQNKIPVNIRVMQKISSYFTPEEKGYLSLILKGQTKEAAAPQPQELVLDQGVFSDALKLAHENPEKLASIYEKACSRLTPQQVQFIEKKAAYDVHQAKLAHEAARQAEIQKGIYQFEGFKMAADAHAQHTSKTAADQSLEQEAPSLAAALRGR